MFQQRMARAVLVYSEQGWRGFKKGSGDSSLGARAQDRSGLPSGDLKPTKQDKIFLVCEQTTIFFYSGQFPVYFCLHTPLG